MATYWTSNHVLLCTVALLTVCIFLISLGELKPFLQKLENDSILPSTYLQCLAQHCTHSRNILTPQDGSSSQGAWELKNPWPRNSPHRCDGHFFDGGHSYGRGECGLVLKKGGPKFSQVDQTNQPMRRGCFILPLSPSFQFIDS